MAEAQEQMNVVEMAEEVYGDCYGPESEYVKLISADGHEFILERKYALISPVLKNMLNGPGEQLMPYIHILRFELFYYNFCIKLLLCIHVFLIFSLIYKPHNYDTIQ